MILCDEQILLFWQNCAFLKKCL